MTSSPSVFPSRWVQDRDDQRLLVVATLAASVVVGYAAAVVAGAPGAALSIVFTMSVPLVALLAWWAFARAPAELRLLVGFIAGAATLWLVGSLVWFYYFVAAGKKTPPPAGPWEAVFLVAYAVALAGVYLAMRRAISLARAALDASVVGAAGIALGAAFVGSGLENGVSINWLATVVRPLLGVITLALLASAALGRWHGLSLSVVLFGVANGFLTVGGLVYTYDAVEWQDVQLRWAELGLFGGTVVAMLAAFVIILGIDRPVRPPRPADIPGHRAGAVAMVYGALGALAVTVAVALYGHFTQRGTVLVVGVTASAWIGCAMALRARGSIRDVERAYARLDRAHVVLERTKDRLAEANEELARANVELRAVHTAFEDLLVLTDERSRGGLRALVEDAGDDLARLLSRYLGHSAR